MGKRVQLSSLCTSLLAWPPTVGSAQLDRGACMQCRPTCAPPRPAPPVHRAGAVAPVADVLQLRHDLGGGGHGVAPAPHRHSARVALRGAGESGGRKAGRQAGRHADGAASGWCGIGPGTEHRRQLQPYISSCRVQQPTSVGVAGATTQRTPVHPPTHPPTHAPAPPRSPPAAASAPRWRPPAPARAPRSAAPAPAPCAPPRTP